MRINPMMSFPLTNNKTNSLSYSRILFTGLLILLFWLPLPFGSKPLWSSSILVVLTCLLGTLWCLGFGAGKLVITESFRKAYFVHLGFVLVCCWLFLQGLGIPESWLEGLSPNAHALWQASELVTKPGQSVLTLSIDPKATEQTFLLSISYYLLFCLVLLLVDSSERVRQLLWVLIAAGIFQALFGSLSTLSGLEILLFGEKEAYLGVATGTFINRNSFAGFLEMTLALGIGLLISRLDGGSVAGWREKLRQFLVTMMSSKVLLRSALAIMVIGLVLSRSRMGNTAFFSSLMITGFLYVVLRRQFSKGVAVLFGSMLLIDVVIVSQWFGIEKVVERIEQTSLERESRPDVSQVSLNIIEDYPLTGTGGGSFYTALPNYHNGSWKGFYDLAHNDFIQFSLEFGIPAFVLLVVMVLMAFWQAIMTIRYRKNRLMTGLGFGVFMGMLAIMIHSSVDFNLQIPANASLFVCLMALAYVSRYCRVHRKRKII
ncbi:O-antigen ligase family protein [Endozoicomonas sp. Mp262]|uniref:O-antigen ligase family protein n=1 Tax=Endozoicomonas sp. Mp262 TaxID=2919499 RepID=UPI0021D8903C